jgi:predicted PurR-regulated permease PerM
MCVLGGILGASLTSFAAWALAGVGTHNLPAPKGFLSLIVVLVVAAAAGFLAGAAIVRRAGRTRDHLALFSCLAGGTCGGLVGCAYAVTLTAAYLSSYSTWPGDRLDQILVVLSYPAFGGVGFWMGALVGLFLGLVVGGMLKIVAPARQ